MSINGNKPELWKSFVSCITLSALCLIPVYKKFAIVHEPELNYFRPEPYTLFLSGVAFGSALLLATLLFAVVLLIRRLAPAGVQRITFAASPLLLIPAGVSLFNNPKASIVAVTVLVCAAAGMAVSRTVAWTLGSAILMLSLLLPVQLATTVWQYVRQPAAAEFAADIHRERSTGPADQAARRVVWMVFDEWDDELTFALRPHDVEMPALDRLRSESVYIPRATAAAEATLKAIPAMVLGKPLGDAAAVDFKTLRATVGGVETSVWSEQSTVFSDARAAGLRTAVVGWYHPYCRVLANAVDYCASYFPLDARASFSDEVMMRRFGLVGSVWRTLRNYGSRTSVGKTLGIEAPARHDVFWSDRVDMYRKIHANAIALASDPKMGLILIHSNVPHLPGIYSRSQNRIVFDAKSNYFDNLELMDTAIAQVRDAMTEAGVWETTTLIVTSDHPLRTRVWETTADWTEEEATITARRQNASIPFLVKVAGQHEGITVQKPFNVTGTRELLSAINTGQVATARDVVSWLSRHAADTTVATTASR